MKSSFHPLFPLAAAAIILLNPAVGSSAPPMQKDKLGAIDTEIEAAIGRGEIPGAVLWLESRGEVYHKAYGRRLVAPGSEEMTKDTIFDVASLTKVMATTPAILKLIEEGRLDLNDPVCKHIPEFLSGGVRPTSSNDSTASLAKPEDRETITVRHLITHQSGLPPGIFLSEEDFWGHQEGIRRAATVGLIEKPGTHFRYSDVNFILLGEIVARISGQRLDQFVSIHFYRPLGMADTTYLPPSANRRRIAPTTTIDQYGLLRGQVHDPTARRMEGVAGHAGLFSTAKDVATYMRAFTTGGGSILGSEMVKEATKNQLPASFEAKRGLGWDISSRFSSQRGERFPLAGYGHTGWTGTSIWVDPASETFLILLANRNHPSEAGRIKSLRITVGTLAGEAVGYSEPVPLSKAATAPDTYHHPSAGHPSAGHPSAGHPSAGHPSAEPTAAGDPGDVLNGIDVLERNRFAALAGKRVGLITNHTGINRQRRSTIDLLAGAPDVELVALFSPEHGIRGVSEADSIDDGRDAATGLPVYSLYKSETRKPTREQMEGLDLLVFDIQDIGCRFYTYLSTMGLAMEAAKAADIPFVVLDRVNPIGGILVDGPVRKGKGNDFVAFHEIPVQHGMTAGELAGLFNAERKVGADLLVIQVEGWSPEMRFDETGLPWVNPSPNIRSLTQAMLYPGVGLVEFTNLSVGRGTATPFEHVGAPWLHDGRLAGELNDEKISGIQFLPTRFTPDASVYEGEDCAGVRFFITDHDRLRPLDLGIALMREIHQQAGDTFNLEEKGNVLLRHPETIALILKGADLPEIRASWQPELNDFLKRREPFLLYPRN